MLKSNQKRGSSFYRTRRPGNNYSRYPKKQFNKKFSQWSEFDLVRIVRETKTNTQVRQEKPYIVKNSFEDFGLHPRILANIKSKNFLTPTPVQDQAIPHILSGKDLIGLANTGTGKTAAFLIPLINKVYKNRSEKVLIIAPTRELAEQIEAEFRTFSAGTGIYSVLIIGGASMQRQMATLRKSPNFVIATPGRLKDLINRKVLNLAQFKNVVLDETDRMVDIGFVQEIKMFISMLPKERQSLFFSATISNKVQEILNSFVTEPAQVNVKRSETGVNIEQQLVNVSKDEHKLETLHQLLIQTEFHKVIIFSNTKRSVQRVSDELVKRGFKAEAIHGDKRQSQRRVTLERFKRNEINVLLATDVAARGLDINNVTHVINYDFPMTYDDYVHRIGRTGRADKKGTALTFVNHPKQK